MKPKSVEIYPVYICNCGNRHCESLEYINKIGKILCPCGDVMELEDIETFKITPVFKSSSAMQKNKTNDRSEVDVTSAHKKEKTTVTPPPKIEDVFLPMFESENKYEQAVDLLESLGWKRKEAKKKVKESATNFCSQNQGSICDSNFENFTKELIFS